MSEDWLTYLKQAWEKSIADRDANQLGMLLRDLVAYGRQTESIDQDFALDIAERIEQLEKLRPEMSPGEISHSIRAILYAKRHTKEAGADYGAGFREGNSPKRRGSASPDRLCDTPGAADEFSVSASDIGFESFHGVRPVDLDNDYAEMD